MGAIQEGRAGASTPIACLRPAAARIPSSASKGKMSWPPRLKRAASDLGDHPVQALVSRARSGSSRLAAAARQLAQPRDQNPRPRQPCLAATQAPPQLPGRLASLFVLFVISPRPARAGLLAAIHLQQSRDQPISWRRAGSRALPNAERRRNRAGATLRPRLPASAGRLPALRPMDLLLCLNRLAVSIIFFFVSLPTTAILGN